MPTLGLKRTWALGSPAASVWAEIWSDIGPRIERVLKTGEATWDEGLLLFLERVATEETYHTFSYSPLADETGVLTACSASSRKRPSASSARPLKNAQGFRTRTTDAKTVDEACRLMVTTLGENTADVPFSLLYVVAPDGKTAWLCEASQLPRGTTRAPK